MIEGAQLLISTIYELQEGKLIEKPQVVLKEYKHAPKIFTETCLINWNQGTDTVYNHIRGLSPYPAAFTIVNNKKMKIFTCEKIISSHDNPPGYIQTDNKSFIHFACNDGWIDVKELQLEGKTKMSTADFLRGNKIN